MTIEQLKKLENSLWSTADSFRANSDLKASEYSTPVLGIIFLKFADNKYTQFEDEINNQFEELKGSRKERTIDEIALEMCGFYLPPESRYSYLLNLSEDQEIDKALKIAMVKIEEFKPELQGVLPQDEYFKLTRTDQSILTGLLKNFSDIPVDASGDIFGKIYEFFLGRFALSEGQGGGEFFTPTAVVKLMVEIMEPHDGTVYDPACGSAGMFVQSANFIRNRQGADDNLFVYGQEKTTETSKLAKMNLAVNGLRGDIRQVNSYYEDPYSSIGKFDYVMANPPFNVDDVLLQKVEDQERFNRYGVPKNKSKSKKKADEETCPNANYLWISLFATSLKEKSGRAALVMANSASDARHSEAEIRKNLIENNLIYGMLTLPSNMFYTVTLPATLWFFDKGKKDDKILFIDARNIFRQIDRAHRDFTQEQVQNIGLISKLHKDDRLSFVSVINNYFEKGVTTFLDKEDDIITLSNAVSTFLKSNKEESIPSLSNKLKEFKNLEMKYNEYQKSLTIDDIEKTNSSQQTLANVFSPFFISLHEMMKSIDKKVRKYEKEHRGNRELKNLKLDLEKLHSTIKEAESFFIHINWLQERFPNAVYEDVTGLCKLATQDEIKEQDYSLNPGRYVGVVIEEDGKTEEEFIEEMIILNDDLEKLNREARELEEIIAHNMKQIVGDD